MEGLLSLPSLPSTGFKGRGGGSNSKAKGAIRAKVKKGQVVHSHQSDK